MAFWVVSDLHLDEDSGARLFRDARQGRALAMLCERVARDPRGELVLLGDSLDLTAMVPPARGLDAFARAVRTELEPPPPRTTRQLCEAVLEGNPEGLRALGRLSERAQVTLLPGNHDRHLGQPEGKDALAAIGLGKVRIAPSLTLTLGDRQVLLAHGHSFDPANAEAGGPGEVMTGCLHQAVVPYLRRCTRGNVRIEPDRVVALRPQESVVPVLQRWLRPEDFSRFFRAFLRLLARNGYLPWTTAWLARIATPERVRKRIEKADQLWERTGRAALRRLEQATDGPHLLVLGHTHVIDWAVQDGARPDDRLYVNLGTWTEKAQDASGPLDLTLPALFLEERDGRCRAALHDLAAGSEGRELQRFDAV